MVIFQGFRALGEWPVSPAAAPINIFLCYASGGTRCDIFAAALAAMRRRSVTALLAGLDSGRATKFPPVEGTRMDVAVQMVKFQASAGRKQVKTLCQKIS